MKKEDGYDIAEIGDVAMYMDSACNKLGFESYSQMKSHNTDEEECRIQIEHTGNMVSYKGEESNYLSSPYFHLSFARNNFQIVVHNLLFYFYFSFFVQNMNSVISLIHQ